MYNLKTNFSLSKTVARTRSVIVRNFENLAAIKESSKKIALANVTADGTIATPQPIFKHKKKNKKAKTTLAKEPEDDDFLNLFEDVTEDGTVEQQQEDQPQDIEIESCESQSPETDTKNRASRKVPKKSQKVPIATTPVDEEVPYVKEKSPESFVLPKLPKSIEKVSLPKQEKTVGVNIYGELPKGTKPKPSTKPPREKIVKNQPKRGKEKKIIEPKQTKKQDEVILPKESKENIAIEPPKGLEGRFFLKPPKDNTREYVGKVLTEQVRVSSTRTSQTSVTDKLRPGITTPQHEELVKYISDTWSAILQQNPKIHEMESPEQLVRKGKDKKKNAAHSQFMLPERTSALGDVVYMVEPPSPLLKDFVPFDLEAFAERRKQERCQAENSKNFHGSKK